MSNAKPITQPEVFKQVLDLIDPPRVQVINDLDFLKEDDPECPKCGHESLEHGAVGGDRWCYSCEQWIDLDADDESLDEIASRENHFLDTQERKT